MLQRVNQLRELQSYLRTLDQIGETAEDDERKRAQLVSHASSGTEAQRLYWRARVAEHELIAADRVAKRAELLPKIAALRKELDL